jgi:hypothetical protein
LNSEQTSEKGSSRRDFLVNAGLFAAGAIAAGGVVGAFSPRKAEAAAALPWEYPVGGLDPEAVGLAGYYGYKSKTSTGGSRPAAPGIGIGGCMYGTGVALVEALAAALPTSPWTTFNPALFTFGGGGIRSWGTLCGSINAAVAIIRMTANNANLINEIMGWYCDFAFPTARYDAVSAYPGQITTVCNSPLCHQSSGKWAQTAGFVQSDPQRGERCAKLAGDCAYKTVELLNAWKAGTITYAKSAPDFQDSVDNERCFSCHVTSPNNYVQGKMGCLDCHPDKVCHNQERL